jgi:hypothetical protein
VYVRDRSVATFEDDRFVDCTSANDGGGMAVFTFSDITLLDCRFEGCHSGQSGGGVYLNSSVFSVLGSGPIASSSRAAFTNCDAVGSGGGLAAASGGNDVGSFGTVDLVRFTDCQSDSMGGGAYLFRTEATFTRNIVSTCVADEGGGVALHSNTSNAGLSPRSDILNNTIDRCRGTAGSGRPGGGMTVAAVGIIDIAQIAGTIITNTLEGAAIRCRKGSSSTGTGRPTIHCTSAHIDSTNTAEDVVEGNNCRDSFSSSPGNLRSDEDDYVPEYCEAIPVVYSLKVCSLDANSNCFQGVPGLLNRGANETTCDLPCSSIISIEPASWGQIKAMYR